MNTHQTLRQTLLALSCAAWLFSAIAHAQQSTPAPGGGGTSIRDILGLPPVGGGGGSSGGGGMCLAPPGGATCGGAGPASQGNTSGVNTGGGNPINLTNGNKYQMEVDLPALPGELGIEIVRHYNSAHRHVVGQLGMGWRLSYETDLYVVGQTVQILQADGARLVFNIDPQNPSLCSGADPAQGWVQILTSARGVKSYVWHWTHGENAGRQLRFDEGGKLVQIAAASGAVLSITRGPKGELLKVTDPQGRSLSFNHGGPGRVRQAEQAQQQQQQASSAANASGGLVGTAPGLAVFTGIQSIDTPVGRFTYAHGVAASASAASSAQAQALARAQAANLTAVSLPTHTDTTQAAHAFANRPLSSSGLRRQYHYEDPRHPLALTGVSVLGSGSDGQVVSQRLSTFLYNERAQASLSVRGEPARLQTDASTGQPLVPARLVPGTGVEQVHVQILQPALPGSRTPGQTLLTNSLGQQTLYTHQIIGGQYRLVQAVGAGCSQCGPVNQRWGYDSLGRLIEQTSLSPVTIQDGQPQGAPQPLLSTRHTLDAQGRTQRIEQVAHVGGKAQPPQLIERHEYADTRWPDKPTLIARPSVVSGLEQQIALSYNEAGQVTELKESGFSPLDVNGKLVGGQPASTPAQASRLERATVYTHTRINGRSLLTQIDGPLPNGPSASPADSDITRLQWDDKGSFLLAVHTPGGLRSDITHDPASGQVQRVVNDASYATTFTFDARQLLVRISSQGPGWAQPQVQSFQYDALGQPVQGFEGDATRSADASSASEAGAPRPTWRQALDAQGRLLWRASALGVLETHAYNPEGQRVHTSRLSNRMAQSEHTEHDELGRPIAWRDGAGRSHELRYGDDGLPQAWRDPLGRMVERGRERGHSDGLAQTAAQQPTQPLQPLRLVDDFGRNVLTLSPDSGTTLRSFDAADRLVAMTDAQGNTARYEYDSQGRILKQTITDAKAKAKTLPDRLTPPTTNTITTEWRYSPRHLLEVIHPNQRERFEVDARGLRTARIVTLITPQGELTSVTRYEHDETGQLVASTLPDGSRLVYERNGQNQVVALKRQTIQTPWLRWLGSDQVLASGFERDLVGLSGYTSGNGIEARYLRSASGDLARVVYRHTQPRAALQARHGNGTQLMGRSTQETIERLLGIAPAHAQAVVPPTPAGSASPASPPSAAGLPGALGSPTDPQALIDHRYLWSAGGHLLHSQQRAGSAAEQTQHSHAYNTRGQLVASVQASLGAPAQSSGGLSPVSLNETAQAQEAQEQSVWRYAYDASQRRMLSQQGVVSQSDISTATQRSQFQDDSHRLSGSGPGNQATTYNANGQPERVGSREYVWDALGRLIEVREETRPIARYQYDHRGLRVGKQVGQSTTHTTTQTLYDESRQPLAELDAQGRITRQYIWLADLPLAVIDTPQGQALAAEAPGLVQLWADVRSAINSWLGSEEGIAWLHTNHLGAPEAATNAQGQLVWRARYAPFGAAQVSSTQSGFTLHLRLPGQVWDEETGLHYNRQRYYDPEQGQYLSPDPLGTPDGPNPYAYVAFNPLTNIDPDGLILFAFDGTGNTNDQQILGTTGSFSNVWQFRNLYDSGNRRYVSGVGTLHEDQQYGNIEHWAGNTLDAGFNYTGVARINRMIQYFNDEADLVTDDNLAMDVDIVGFSRGAAQARDFANLIIAGTTNGFYRYRVTVNGRAEERCQRVNFRFMGLFDTVLSNNRGRGYNLGIPEAFSHVAHAIALNEYRGDDTRRLPGSRLGAFPLESIMQAMASPVPVAGQTRIERGFVGAHADIGGGFGPGADSVLARVALAWMVQQARDAGINMQALPVNTIPASPVLHDKSDNQYCLNGPGCEEDRQVRYRGGATTTQRNMPVPAGMSHAETARFIRYLPPGINADGSVTREPQGDFVTGTVDARGYLQWLRNNGYNLGNLQVQ